MDETYGTYVDDESFDNHEHDDDTVRMIPMMIVMMIPTLS